MQAGRPRSQGRRTPNISRLISVLAPDTLLQERYRVIRQLAKGGMGTVYMARDQRFGNTVALKEACIDRDFLRKAFEREARLLNHLRHAALPVVTDFFTEGGQQFLVMQFIPGKDPGRDA